MDLKLLATLKEKVQTEKKFAKIWEYFLDNFGENPDFFNHGERTKSPFLEIVLEQVGTAVFQKQIKPKNVLLVSVPEHRFIHGACTLGGAPANVIYFEDIEIGLVGIILPSSSRMHYARFTRAQMEKAWEPSAN